DGIRDATVTGVQTCALPILEIYEAIDRFGERYEADMPIARYNISDGTHQCSTCTSHVQGQHAGFFRRACPLCERERLRITVLAEIGRASCKGKSVSEGCEEQ